MHPVEAGLFSLVTYSGIINGGSLSSAERAVLHAEGFEREAYRKCSIRRLQRRFDLRDIAAARIQLYIPACAGRTLWLLQQADEGVGRDDERAARSES